MDEKEFLELEEHLFPTPPKKYTGPEIFWTEHEYEFSEKSSEWFWLMGAVAFLGIVLSFVFKNFLLALIILVSSFILGTHAKHGPKEVTYGITHKGIRLGETLFRFKSIHSFWIDTQNKNLIIESERWVKHHIHIPLKTVDVDEVHRSLSSVLLEKEYHESFTDFVVEFFGF
jgi:hypothetical protein